MESVLDEDDIPLEEKEELKFIVTQAKKNIEAWKPIYYDPSTKIRLG
jgi:hypothetical protein